VLIDIKRVGAIILDYKSNFYYSSIIITSYYINKYSYYSNKKKVNRIIY